MSITSVGTALERTAADKALIEQDSAMRTRFFENISHEFRTPLTLIITPIDALLANPADLLEPVRASLEAVHRNASRLMRMLSDLLDLGKADSGHLRLSVMPVDLSGLVHQLGTLFAPTAEARGVTLHVDAPTPTSDTYGDEYRLDTVLSNLLGNALKYTPKGGRITLRVTHDAKESRVSVSDTGPGIDPKHLPHIFERFYQAGVTSEQNRGGVGIGLSLAKNFTALHGGRLEVQSAVGKGTTFTVVLPKGTSHFKDQVLERRRVQRDVGQARRTTDATDEHFTPVPLRGTPDVGLAALELGPRARVLIVEDNEEMRALLVGVLSPVFDTLIAVDGEDGLAKTRSLRPDAVVSDVMMPKLRGTDMCTAIKKDPQLQSTPVILLTARGGPEAAIDGFASGADEFVEKPFHPRVLLARVHAQVRMRRLALELNAQSRLAAVGTLAAGVGHEVRNPINAVLNGVRLLQQKPIFSGNDAKLLAVIADGAERIEGISQALLTHASPAERGGDRPVDIASGLESTLRLLGHRLNDVTVHKQLGEARVVAPAGELNQVFLNLIDNAIRAPSKNIWLTVTRQNDGVVRVTVEDDGPGISPETVPRLFTPFFTTREVGEGTGLGLYLSRQSIRRLGGYLGVVSRPGERTVFEVRLPGEAR
ncbi:MAG: response regulator [Archangium sp.]|nr:response regulator [Archangium sp.]